MAALLMMAVKICFVLLLLVFARLLAKAPSVMELLVILLWIFYPAVEVLRLHSTESYLCSHLHWLPLIGVMFFGWVLQKLPLRKPYICFFFQLLLFFGVLCMLILVTAPFFESLIGESYISLLLESLYASDELSPLSYITTRSWES